MGTKVICNITSCEYNFDNLCTRKEITISMTSISGIPRYATCIIFKDTSDKLKKLDEAASLTNRAIV